MNTDFVTFSEAPQTNKRFYNAAETNVTSLNSLQDSHSAGEIIAASSGICLSQH